MADGRVDNSGRGAALVAAGILASRLFGLVRQSLLSMAFGVGPAAAAIAAATRIPNFLQNLLGEGVLSASFIPAYVGLVAKKQTAAADALAGAVFGILTLVVSVIVALGMTFSAPLVAALAPGFTGDTRELTVTLVRVLFPATGTLVLSAWCLGVLNSHGKFFLSYAAPVASNVVIIATLLWFRATPDLNAFAVLVAWGTVGGAAAQFLVQVPSVLNVLGTFRVRIDTRSEALRGVVSGFIPAVAARGVVQLSAFVDTAIASLISERAVAALTNAQTISLLPVSLFGMSISAAALPELSKDATGDEATRAQLVAERLSTNLRRISFFVVPSAVAFVVMGDAIAGGFFQWGRFTAADSTLVWVILAGAAVGLVAQTSGRLYASAFYALKDTQTPLRIAMVRVGLGAAAAFVAATQVTEVLRLPRDVGAAALTAATGASAWLEVVLLRRALKARNITPTRSAALELKVWAAAAAAGAMVLALRPVLPEWHPRLTLPLLVAAFGATYAAVTVALGIPQAQAIWARIRRR